MLSKALLPTRDGHTGALTRFRRNGNLVAQPTGTTQTKPHPLPACITVLQRQFDIGDTRSLILKDDAHTTPRAVDHDVHDRVTAFPVVERVTGKLARRGYDLCLIHQPQTRFDRKPTHLLANPHHVFASADRHGTSSHPLPRPLRSDRG